MGRNIEGYKGAAILTFAMLKPAYGWASNFWRLGHSFDTIIDYFAAVDKTDSLVFAEYALDRFRKTNGHWYDDYGWWGLAALRASQHADLFGQHTGDFKEIALKCWNFMHAGQVSDMKVDCCKDENVHMSGAPNVWANGQKDKKHFGDLEPLFPDGVWNCDWKWSENKDEDPCYCVPIYEEGRYWARDALGGFQNTVTNALYLALASRIYTIVKSSQTSAIYEYVFLDKWFKNSDSLLIDVSERDDELKLARAVARERVPSYKNGHTPWGYKPEMAWAGDQGALLSSLIDYMALVKEEETLQEIQELCKQLILGTKAYLMDEQTGLLRDWWNPQDSDNAPPGGDADDYRTGSGVFWRFLVHVCKRDAKLKALIKADDYQDFIAKNADAACSYIPGEELPFDETVIVMTNKLATLVAAIELLDPGM